MPLHLLLSTPMSASKTTHTSENDHRVTLRFAEGSGRNFIVICESGGFFPIAEALVRLLSQRQRAWLLATPVISDSNWETVGRSLVEFLPTHSIRQTSLVGLGPANVLAQHLALVEPKLVRSLCLVNPTARAHPSSASRMVDWLEAHLPLGLPLRSRTKGFDGRSLAQRLRCPLLVALVPPVTAYQDAEARKLAQSAPTAWVHALGSEDPKQELCALLEAFQDVPAKCPQKGVPASISP